MTEPQLDQLIEAPPAVVGRSPFVLGMRRFKANKAAMVSAVLVVAMMGACFGGYAYGRAGEKTWTVGEQEDLAVGQPHPWPPSPAHPFGTDTNGRDLLMRTLEGGAISLGVGLVSAAISVIIGTFYGAIAGQAGGAVDRWMMRLVDTLYGLPYILLVILILVYAQQSLAVLFVAIGCVMWLTMARIIRGQVLRLRQEEFIVAARALGAGPVSILLRHMVPNLLGPIAVCATLTVPVAILQESFLSFLGLGISAPLASWGTLASDGVQALSPMVNTWWLLVFPCALLALTLLALNFIGDGLRDAFDPKLTTGKT
ncbi:MAG: ABC transporter permease [Planctomycetes bacterium]|nr:ABC transporter permease [Planctomycetota bacterium]